MTGSSRSSPARTSFKNYTPQPSKAATSKQRQNFRFRSSLLLLFLLLLLSPPLLVFYLVVVLHTGRVTAL